jgi:hypothetical protein
MEIKMSLQEILQKIVKEKQPILLNDQQKNWEPGDLLNLLSAARLKTKAYLQPGLYIAEINESGYLGRVLYKVIPKTV